MSVSDPVSLTDLVVILINIMYQHPKALHRDGSCTGGACTHTHRLKLEFKLPHKFVTLPVRRRKHSSGHIFYLLPLYRVVQYLLCLLEDFIAPFILGNYVTEMLLSVISSVPHLDLVRGSPL